MKQKKLLIRHDEVQENEQMNSRLSFSASPLVQKVIKIRYFFIWVKLIKGGTTSIVILHYLSLRETN